MARANRTQLGETLVESLVTILIVALVTAFLMQGIIVSVRINESVEASDVSVNMDDPQSTGKVTVVLAEGATIYDSKERDAYVVEDNSDDGGEKTTYNYYE